MAICPQCGNTCPDGDLFCRICGRALTTVNAPASSAPVVSSGKATASMICGFFFLVLPSAIVAIVLGHVSLSEIRRSAGRMTGDGRAIAGLVLGYMGVLAVPFILIIAAIAIPNLLRARIAANESAAVATVRSINNAEMSFSTQQESRGYACSIRELSSAGFSGLPASQERYGYRFELANCGGDTPAANSRYTVVAEPINRNRTGVRAFCSDQSGLIRYVSDGSGSACLDHGTELP